MSKACLDGKEHIKIIMVYFKALEILLMIDSWKEVDMGQLKFLLDTRLALFLISSIANFGPLFK